MSQNEASPQSFKMTPPPAGPRQPPKNSSTSSLRLSHIPPEKALPEHDEAAALALALDQAFLAARSRRSLLNVTVAPAKSSSESTSTVEATPSSKRKAREVQFPADAVVKKTKVDSKAPKKRIGPSHYDEIVHLEVGPTGKSKQVSVHRGALCFYSKYFERAFMGAFKEAKDGVMKMPEDDPEVVKIFVRWVYSQKLFDEDGQGGKTVPLSVHTLCRLYALGDMLDAPTFRHTVVDTLLKKVDDEDALQLEMVKMVPTVYETTLATSPLRKIFVDYHVQHLIGCELIECHGLEPLPKRFLMDFGAACHHLLEFDIRHAAKAQTRRSTCYYHGHESGEKCE